VQLTPRLVWPGRVAAARDASYPIDVEGITAQASGLGWIRFLYPSPPDRPLGGRPPLGEHLCAPSALQQQDSGLEALGSVVALFHVAISDDGLSADLPTHHGATTVQRLNELRCAEGGYSLSPASRWARGDGSPLDVSRCAPSSIAGRGRSREPRSP
jgi:hypothetical protein